jgi:hypothetical protein
VGEDSAPSLPDVEESSDAVEFLRIRLALEYAHHVQSSGLPQGLIAAFELSIARVGF